MLKNFAGRAIAWIKKTDHHQRCHGALCAAHGVMAFVFVQGAIDHAFCAFVIALIYGWMTGHKA